MSQRIIFKNQQGKRLVGLIDRPRRKPPYPAVIICHGFKGFKEQAHLRSLALTLAKAGILAFRFDFTNGIGESDGILEDISFQQGLDDIHAAVDYICRQDHIDCQRLGLAGHSLGAEMVFHYAPTDDRIKVIADLAGVTSWGKNEISTERHVRSNWRQIKKAGRYTVESKSKNKIYSVKLGFFFELIRLNTLAHIKKINIPAIIVHGTKDESVPVIQSQRAYKLLKQPKKLVIVSGAGHTWVEPKYYKKINPIITEWFKKYL